MSDLPVGRQIAGLVLALVIVFSAAALGIPFTARATAGWYGDIAKPSWTPPNWLFGPVWTVLYTMMALAVWLIWRQGRGAANRIPLQLFFVQLLLNAAWTPIFFGARAFGLAAVEIMLLWCAILLCLVAFARSKPLSAWLMLPYLAWVSFAAVLNVTLWWMNR